KTWLFFIVSRTDLYQWSKTAHPNAHRFSCCGISSQMPFMARAISMLQGVLNALMERSVKVLQHDRPIFTALGDFVNFFLYFGGKIIIDDIPKMFYQKIVYQHTDISRKHFRPFRARNFCFSFFYDFIICNL